MTNFKTLFETKENYLSFRKTWAESVNNPEFTKKISNRYSNKWCKLDSAHFLLYNILRNKPAYNGFGMITNHNKLVCSDMLPYQGFQDAKNILNRMAAYAKDPDRKMWGDSTYGARVTEWLAPFGNTVTFDMVIKASDYLDENFNLLVNEMMQKKEVKHA